MAGLPPPPPGTDVWADRSPQLIAAEAVTFAFASIGVILRFITRYYSGAGYWLDDWLMIPAYAMATGILIVASHLSWIFGKHVWAVGWDAQWAAMQWAFADEIMYNILLACTKLSMLALYWRVFQVTKIRIPIVITAFVVIGWVISSIVSNTLQCDPVSKDWNLLEPGHCFNTKAYFIANAICNIVTDAALLSLPIQPIWRIQTHVAQKLLITGTFVLGALTMIFSCVRLWVLLNIDLTSLDFTWNYSDTWIWSALELNIAILAVCLPTLRPFYKFCRTGSFIDPSYNSSRHTGSFGRSQRPAAQERAASKSWDITTMQQLESGNHSGRRSNGPSDEHSINESS